MKKLRLRLDDLSVSTFPASLPAPEDARGSVDGHGAATSVCPPTFPLTECPRSAFPTCGIYC